MKFVYVIMVMSVLVCLQSFSSSAGRNENTLNRIQNNDTCIIEGMVFQLVYEESPQELNATIRNEKVEVLSDNQTNNYRVIRYVFSIIRDEKLPLVRSFGSLVSYPVIQNLKKSNIGDKFYFEDIVVANSNKKVQNNLVKPIIIERIK